MLLTIAGRHDLRMPLVIALTDLDLVHESYGTADYLSYTAHAYDCTKSPQILMIVTILQYAS
jgi:hypothetical protein